MDVVTWTGNGSSPRTISGLNFSPDLVWIKNRTTSGYWNVLFDVIRGGGQLSSNQTDAELAAGSNIAGYVSAYTSNGFTLSAGSSNINTVNENGSGIVGWCWDAGSSTVTNTQGSITSQVRANASAGFSIVTYTGTGVTGTVGHGLGVKPGLIIVKNRDSVLNWIVYHSARGATEYAWFNTTAAFAAASGPWNDTEPTSSVFTVGGANTNNNESTKKIVAYCFAPVAGYSSFGSYTGNGSTDGPFVYTGFRPAFVMIKCSSSFLSPGNADWRIVDSKRNTSNVEDKILYANLSASEDTVGIVDFLSNGFKLRQVNYSNVNAETYIYAAFAESPFQYARAR